MDISELNQKIFTLGNRLADLQAELKDYKAASRMAFSFTANWRDKKSILLRIPILEKEVESIKNEYTVLKSERDMKVKSEEYNKLIEAKKAEIEAKKVEQELKFSIDNPISLFWSRKTPTSSVSGM